MTLIEAGVVLIAIGICILAIAYNFTLAGYSRKKMLRGISFEDQMCDRREISSKLRPIGCALIGLAILMIFVLHGLLATAKTVEIVPCKVDTMLAQGKTIVMMDGKVHVFDKEHHRIGRIYTIEKTNIYGLVIDRTIHISGGELWERVNE